MTDIFHKERSRATKERERVAKATDGKYTDTLRDLDEHIKHLDLIIERRKRNGRKDV